MNANDRYIGRSLASRMLLLTTLACGGFQVRVTPTAHADGDRTVPVAATPRPARLPRRPRHWPAPCHSPRLRRHHTDASAAGMARRIGKSRGQRRCQHPRQPSPTGKTGRQAGITDVIVTVLDGPIEADGYTWWKVDDGKGMSGLGRGRHGQDDPWLAAQNAGSGPAANGSGKLVNRAIELGDRVQVTTRRASCS